MIGGRLSPEASKRVFQPVQHFATFVVPIHELLIAFVGEVFLLVCNGEMMACLLKFSKSSVDPLQVDIEMSVIPSLGDVGRD